MEIVVSQAEGQVPVTVFQIIGDLTSEEPLQNQTRQAFDDGTRYLLLDLRKVPYISSSGLRAIHYAFDLLSSDSGEDEQARRRGIISGTYKSQHLKLLKPTKNAKKALQVAGYDMFLEIHQKYDEAIASY